MSILFNDFHHGLLEVARDNGWARVFGDQLLPAPNILLEEGTRLLELRGAHVPEVLGLDLRHDRRGVELALSNGPDTSWAGAP